MRLLLAFALVCMTAGVAGAAQWSAGGAPVKGITSIGGQSDLLEGGETFGSAIVVGSLPFHDTGATCDNSDDINLVTCGYGYYSPDVVYVYTAGSSGTIDITTCGLAGYDTMLGVFNAGLAEIACNDDYCGFQSTILGVPVTAGSPVYIVVDGYAGGCGSYDIVISGGAGPCVITCPGGAELEGEPVCHDDYYDSYNGGCNSVGWQDICPQNGNHAVLCGESGTYYYFGLSYRDTDWFRVYGTGGTMTATLEGDFNTQLIFIYGTNCASPLYDYTTGVPCSPVSLSRTVGAGVETWIWVGASQFSGIPCGSDYVLTLDGIYCTGTATENATWGNVKSLYR